MNWPKLLTPYRLGCPKDDCKPNEDRNRFQRDFDRIIFSTDFRRLYGKTQVVPFPETDIIHTRMTHSLESVSVGRSLGNIVNNNLDLDYEESSHKYFCDKIGAIVSAGCLAHDLGNPPFGHSGEDAIREFFSSPEGNTVLKGLSREQKEDFLSFEGNAMTFHILTYSNPARTEVTGGLGLTYPTLAALIKYPRPAVINNYSDKASEKKPGLLQTDLETFAEIAEELGILKKTTGDKWFRHPLAFLTEAADDICYLIMDFEDGYKHDLIEYDVIFELLHRICIDDLENTDISGLQNIKAEEEKIGFLRSKSINSLIYQAADVFLKNETKILNGKFDDNLCHHIESYEYLQVIEELSIEKIYSTRSTLEIEAAGFKVIPELLDIFLSAVRNPDKASNDKVKKLIPEEYLFDYNESAYQAIMGIIHYVTGMTDNYAVDIYRKLNGIEIPNYK